MRNTPTIRIQDRALILLVAISVLLPIWNRYGMNYSLKWDFPNDMPFEVVTDVADNGVSFAKAIQTDSSILIAYNLKEGSRFPFAGFKFQISHSFEKGIDLSCYDSVRVWLRSTDTINTIKVILKNYDGVYSKAGDPVSLKYNEIEFDPHKEKMPFTFALQDLRVPSWWIGQRQISLDHSQPDLRNVVEIEIPTGSTHLVTQGSFELMKVELHGKWIRATSLYPFILGVWVTGAIFLLFARFRGLMNLNRDLQVRNRQFKSMAEHDPLTKALNRLGLRNQLMEWRQLPPEHAFPLSVILMDLDHFKEVNDEFGHHLGDEVLQKFCARMQDSIRARDLLVRWGGEEFMVLCLNTNLKQARALAEKLRLSLIESPLIPEKRITVSAGLSQAFCWDIARITEDADAALYRAKTRGRNQISE